MKLRSITIFLILLYCSCSPDGKRAESDKDTASGKVNTQIAPAPAPDPAQLKTTFDSLQGVWIPDNGDTLEKMEITIKGDSIFYSNSDNIYARERFYISQVFTYKKEDILPQTKSGNYFIEYSSAIDDIRSCVEIDTLTKNKLVFFDKEEGKHGLSWGYHK
jgi:hypothetical protein